MKQPPTHRVALVCQAQNGDAITTHAAFVSHFDVTAERLRLSILEHWNNSKLQGDFTLQTFSGVLHIDSRKFWLLGIEVTDLNLDADLKAWLLVMEQKTVRERAERLVASQPSIIKAHGMSVQN